MSPPSTSAPRRRAVAGLFVAGTDTEVGKTYVAALLARTLVAAGRQVGVYKPAASGCRREGDRLVSDDALALWEAAGRPGRLDDVCPQRFAAPLAPHLAARAEGRTLDGELLRKGLAPWTKGFDVVLVEGAGGLLSPLGEEDYVAELAYDFGFPLLVVAANRIGAINQALQTLIVATTFREGLDVAGVVLNDATPDDGSDPSRGSNPAELAARTGVPILGRVPHGATSLPAEVDWGGLPRKPQREEAGEW